MTSGQREMPCTIKNRWAAANSPYGSGFVDVPIDLYVCPRCGTAPGMVTNENSTSGLLCFKCGFGIRPTKPEYKSFERWNKAVEQYVEESEVSDD